MRPEFINSICDFFVIDAGEMSNCPAYLGVSIEDLFTTDGIFLYDFLILCPSNFTLTFRLPGSVDRTDVAFRVKFTDPQKSYDVTLSQITLADDDGDETTLELTSPAAADVTTSTVVGAAFVHVTMALFVVLVLGFGFAYACLENERRSAEREREQFTAGQSGVKPVSVVLASSPTAEFTVVPNRAKDAAVAGSSRRGQRVYVGVFLVLWSVYCVTFTVTILFNLVAFVLRPEWRQLVQLADLESERGNLSANLSAAVDGFREGRTRAQQRLVGDMRRACSNHVGALYRSVASDMVAGLFDRTTSSRRRGDDPGSSVSRLLGRRLQARLDYYRDAAGNFSRDLRVKVTADVRRSMRGYRKYIEGVFWSGWMTFAQRIFNDSAGFRRRILPGNFESLFSGKEVEFGMFLEIEEIELVQLWSTEFWER